MQGTEVQLIDYGKWNNREIKVCWWKTYHGDIRSVTNIWRASAIDKELKVLLFENNKWKIFYIGALKKVITTKQSQKIKIQHY